MEKRNIVNTNFLVSSICLGTMTFGTPVREKEAIEIVHYAIDKGVNFIDTANMYEGYSRTVGSRGGVAEEILGKALAGKRDQVILATKVGMKVGELPEDEGTSAKAIRKQLEQSLKRLATDNIDIFYLHKADPQTPLIEILSVLAESIQEGKIKSYGISNFSAMELNGLLSVADANQLPRPVICQPPLSILKKDHLNTLIPLCVKEQIAVAPYQVLQGGLLTGKYRIGEPLPKDSRKAEKKEWVWDLTVNLFEQLESIEIEVKKADLTMIEFAIRWVLNQAGVVSAIVGVKRKEQIDEAIVAASSG